MSHNTPIDHVRHAKNTFDMHQLLFIKPSIASLKMRQYDPTYAPERMGKPSKYKNSKDCLCIQQLTDIDPLVLAKIITHSVKTMRANHPCNTILSIAP
jgi:hypothetical protein